MNRRRFITTSIVGAAIAPRLLASGTPAGAVTPIGKLVHDCSLPGQGRENGAFPAHPNGVRLSKDRFLLLYATRGWRGVDEDRSIIYQVRAGGFDGVVLKEGILAATTDTWDPFGDGSSCFKGHGHPCGFGVPKGALIGGRPAPNANLFVLKWYSLARAFSSPDRLQRPLSEEAAKLSAATIRVEWTHVRLNDAENDIEILEPVSTLRAPEYEAGDPNAERLSLTYVHAVPFNANATDWLSFLSVRWSEPGQQAGSGSAPARFRYSPSRHRYGWVQTGPRFIPAEVPASEGGLVPLDDGWAIFARPHKDADLPLLWARVDDPFKAPARKLLIEPRAGQPIVRGPVSAYRCADGKIRVFTGSREISPYANRRHPLYCWEADPENDFALTRRQVVFDILAQDRGIRPESEPIADMCKLMPHSGGRSQLLVHRFRTESINYLRERPASTNPEPHFRISPEVTETEREAHGIYYARLDYGDAYPDPWTFAKPSSG